MVDLDVELGKLIAGFEKAYSEKPLWLAASEYVITAVNDVTYPNRVLREAGLLKVSERTMASISISPIAKPGRWWIISSHTYSCKIPTQKSSRKWPASSRSSRALPKCSRRKDLAKYKIDHPRCGDLVLISDPHSWQAYYYWLDDAKAPQFARTVDIHRKPGYDPVELFFDARSKTIPLNANLVRGSHGARRKSRANGACCSLPNLASSLAGNWPIRKWRSWC